MSSLVTIKLPQRDAEACARGEASALRRAKAAISSALQQLKDKAERKVARKRALKLPTPAPKKSGAWPTLKLRRAVFERSEGRCESPRCRRRIRWHTFDLDHFLGRGKAEQCPENTWALCNFHLDGPACHQMKHAGRPSRAWWLEVFLEFLRAHGFGESDTAREVDGQLQAERAGAELDRRRRERAAPERRCALAGEPCPNGATDCAVLGPGDEDFCHGCRQYVCSNHEGGTGVFGSHDVRAHLGEVAGG